MDCGTVRRALSRRTDGEPAGVPEEELTAHVAACTGCGGFLRTIQAVQAGFAARPRPDAPPGLRDAVLARLRSPAGRLLELRPLLRAVAVAAAVLLLVSGSALALLPAPSGRPAPVAMTADGALDLLMTRIVVDHAPATGPEDDR